MLRPDHAQSGTRRSGRRVCEAGIMHVVANRMVYPLVVGLVSLIGAAFVSPARSTPPPAPPPPPQSDNQSNNNQQQAKPGSAITPPPPGTEDDPSGGGA